MNYKCSICNNSEDNNTFTAMEMMFGIEETFDYFECSNCGSLQICKVPENLEKYYPENYYSFDGLYKESISKTERYVHHQRLKNYLYKKNIVGNISKKIYGDKYFYEWLKIAGVKENSKILDVGCGNGQFLIRLYNEGFNNLTGVDAYYDNSKNHSDKINLYKKEIFDIHSDKFDFITLNHSLEHMIDHHKVFNKLFELLEDNSTVLVRTPIVGYGWNKFKTNWIELDPPRHFIIHSKKSMEILASSTGFKITETLFDSTGLEILGSIQAQKNIPYRSEKSYIENSDKSIFSKKEIESYENEIKELNKSGESGRACFFIRKRKTGESK